MAPRAACPDINQSKRLESDTFVMRERSKNDVLQADFLEIRQRILDLAAMLDRYDAAGDASTTAQSPDPRLAQIREGIAALSSSDRCRAEDVQRIFSLAYDPQWQDHFGLKRRF